MANRDMVTHRGMPSVYRRTLYERSGGALRHAFATSAMALALFACGENAPEREPEPEDGGAEPDFEPPEYGSWPHPLEHMPRGPEHTAAVCERDGDDLVRDVFCAGEPRTFTSLVELQRSLAIDSSVMGGVTGLSVTAHSTALALRSVSAINPRVIALRLEYEPHELLALAFSRGEQFSEIVVRDRQDKQLRFYVVGFRQACNDEKSGCGPGDLLTPAIEENWNEVTLYDEQDLTNTVMDCMPCHQPEGPDTTKILRMQELDPPWTHWLFTGREGGRALIDDYFAAKGEEPLAGMTAEQIRFAHPGNLAMLAKYDIGSIVQPNVFATQAIEDEVKASAAERGGQQPVDNSIPGESATWRAAYERAMAGEAIPVPYHDVKIADAEKLAEMSEAYRAYREGELDAADLPDIRDVFPEDEKRLAAMGVMTEPDLDGRGVLLQACSQCHNARLDQSLSRARFRADLEGMDRAAKDRAIDRLLRPPTDPAAMPPLLLKELSAEARQRAIEALRE